VTVYAIAQLRFTDRTAYDRPQVVEGSWDREKVVLMSFPDEPEFRWWSESAEYQEISKDRDAGADTVVLLVRGLA
jgi:uncharacterized protein (DUF1330 family)